MTRNAGDSRQNWGTPPHLVRAAEIEIGARFALDAAAEAWSAKAPRFFTEADNGLVQPWATWTFVNPPYEIQSEFLEKAVAELADRGVCSVHLVKAATSERYWRPLTYEMGTIDLFEGRIAHIAPPGGVWLGKGRNKRFYPGGEPVAGADFASALVWYGPGVATRRVRYRDARTGLLISEPDRRAA